MTDHDLRRVALVLIGVDVMLALVYLAEVLAGMPSWTLHQLVNLDAEATIAAWYTSAKLLLAGTLFLLLAARATTTGGRRRGDTTLRVNVGSRSFLFLVGLALVFLSLDETASLHEQITASLRRFEALPRFTGNHGLWVPFLLVGGTGFLAATARPWLRLWRCERHGTLLMGTGLVVGLLGAVSLEIVSYELIRPAGARTLYVVEVAMEEGLEMIGATLLLMGSMRIHRTGTAPVDGRVVGS